MAGRSMCASLRRLARLDESAVYRAYRQTSGEKLAARYLTSIPHRDTLYPCMAYKATTIEELIAIMKRVQGEKTLTKFAEELDMSKQYLSNVYNRHKEPSERLLDKLGFTRQTTYVRSPTAASREKKR
jgi:hypothetical protein